MNFDVVREEILSAEVYEVVNVLAVCIERLKQFEEE